MKCKELTGLGSSAGGCFLLAYSRAARASLLLLLAAFAFILFAGTPSVAQARRVVVVKVDGLPFGEMDAVVRQRDPRTGKSLLPWIDYVFYQRGTRVPNFYTRGMSLSGPSWSLLDTGQHLQIKGNVEYDRLTLHTYDYLNFIPFYMQYYAQRRADMPGVEVLDELGLPLLMDAYPFQERYPAFQLFQRGARWMTIGAGIKNYFTEPDKREVLDEWTMGIETRRFLQDQMERELISKLNDPRYRYLDYYTTEFDHQTHHNRDKESHFYALQELDGIIGRIWTAIEKSPLARETVMVIVSDHGVNSSPAVYSQGFNLVKLLGSPEGGGHHVITKRRLMLDYAIKGINPLVPLITTTTNDSYYLKGQSTDYPTVLLDFDGNERSSIHLRDSALNVLHILLQQLRRKDLKPEMRRAMTASFFDTIDRRRAGWELEIKEITEELTALGRAIERERALYAAKPKEWTRADLDAGRNLEARRNFARLDSWASDQRDYTTYLSTLGNLLSLRRDTFDPFKLKIEDVIAKRSMGDHNSIYELQNYVVAASPSGFRLKADGSLDMEQSFKRVDYFSLLHGVSVRNNVQAGVGNRPIDFVAARIPRERILPLLPEELQFNGDCLWIYGGAERQALILGREDERGRTSLRYLPIKDLKMDAGGRISFERAPWQEGLPFRFWEDKNLRLPADTSREAFLDDWHTDVEWLHALHKTEYSNGLIGIYEQLARHTPPSLDVNAAGLSEDERLLRRFRKRQRELAETDLLILANNHWNFDVRGFNPGGNHGSFFRVSTNSTLMFWGGDATSIPRGAVVDEPYDSLSFVPTVLALTGQLSDGERPLPILWERGFRPFPGRPIQEVLGKAAQAPQPVAKGDGSQP
ncbi:MAG TPA: alkaline phosphatase family protein [Pyrinomonadaceae bacterium]|nr:alkaline phosphatase family protein [Pyrinomonadaceae bacterium]